MRKDLTNRMNRREFLQSTSMSAALPQLLGQGLHVTSRPQKADSSASTLVSFRIAPPQWLTDERFQALLAFFRKHPKTADELAFFTSGTHAPLTLQENLRRADRLSRVMALVRQEGMSAGINILATMGHHEENLESSLDEPWQRVVDPRGRESRGSYCPAGVELLEYTRKVYTALAEASPDFIWIDDDVRLAGHLPITHTCFCQPCVQRFSKKVRRNLTRDSLVIAFSSGSLEERLLLRRQWLQHNRETIDDLFGVIEQTVHRVHPKMPLGFMTGDRFYEGYDFANWAKTLAGTQVSVVRWRPGGGFYSDESLSGLVEKAHDIGRQVSQLPAQVKVIQSEIENFPYDLLRKSAETTVIEAAAHMAAGTTGTAFNVLSQRDNPVDEYEPMLHRIQRAKSFYRTLQAELGRTPVTGMWPAWSRDTFSANNIDGQWLERGDAVGTLRKSYVLGEIGIPLCYSQASAVATILAGPSVLAFKAQELKQIFAGGVLMDVSAWHALDRLSLASWTGVQPGQRYERDAIEVLAKHSINERFGGWSRDCRQSFPWREDAYSLDPQSAGVGVLAQLTDYSGRDLGPSMTAFENELGGRVVVMGYFPWTQMHSLAKATQIKAVSQWLSRDRLPVFVESFANVQIWARETGPGRMACVLLNASLDPLEKLTLHFRETFKEFDWLTIDGELSRLQPAIAANTRGFFRTPGLKPWGIYLLRARA